MFQNIGTTEIVIIALLIIVLFGGKKIPELMRGIGESIKEFPKQVKKTNKKELVCLQISVPPKSLLSQ